MDFFSIVWREKLHTTEWNASLLVLVESLTSGCHNGMAQALFHYRITSRLLVAGFKNHHKPELTLVCMSLTKIQHMQNTMTFAQVHVNQILHANTL